MLDWIEDARRNPLLGGAELRPFTDLVFLIDGDPIRCGEAFAGEAAAVVPRPLPDNDALLRAHLRWLASCRRSRTRGLLLRNALAAPRRGAGGDRAGAASGAGGDRAARPPTSRR